jgi:hypothetical protein
MTAHQPPKGPARHDSSQRRIELRGRSETLLYVLRTYPRRWSAAAVAAVLALPEVRSTDDEWIALLDQLDDLIRDAVFG